MTPTTSWPPPPPASTRAPLTRDHKIWLGVFAVVIVLAAISAAGGKDTAGTGSGTKYYALAGWSVSRAADLSIKIQYDDGVSRTRADCAMKGIIEGVTWLEWQSFGATGQLSAIRAAETAC